MNDNLLNAHVGVGLHPDALARRRMLAQVTDRGAASSDERSDASGLRPGRIPPPELSDETW
jgi:hypothetical protein